MDLIEIFNLALSAILRNRLRSFLTILGIVIGVLSVILLVALVSGLQKTITETISSFGSNTMYIFPGQIGGSGSGPGGTTVNRLTMQDATNLKNKLRGKAEVSAAVVKANNIKYGNKISKNAEVTGADANMPKIVSAIKVVKGKFFSNSDANSGKRVAVVGPTVENNLFPGGSALGKKVQIGSQTFEIIGVMEKRGSVFGQDQDNSAIIPLNTAIRQFGVENVNYILASTKNIEDVPEVQKKIQQVLEERLQPEDFTVQTSEQTLSIVSQITGVLTLALGGIAAISLLVGGIGVMNIMLVSVTERTREIGLRKALGAKPSDIRYQFLIEAVTLSGFGGLIGIVLGILISFLINFFLATSIPIWSIALSFGFSMLVGIIFGVAPAIRASRLNPIQALRYE